MKVDPNTSVVDFLKAVASCREDVVFQTNEGDSLNLKSALSQFVFAVVFTNPEILSTGTILCHCAEDAASLAPYLLEATR